MSHLRFFKVAEFVRRYPLDFSKPAWYAGGELVILMRKALLSELTITAKSASSEEWVILPFRLAEIPFVTDRMDPTPFYELGILKDVTRHKINTFGYYKSIVDMLKGKFLTAQREADKAAAFELPNADEAQAAALIIADAIDFLQSGEA